MKNLLPFIAFFLLFPLLYLGACKESKPQYDCNERYENFRDSINARYASFYDSISNVFEPKVDTMISIMNTQSRIIKEKNAEIDS